MIFFSKFDNICYHPISPSPLEQVSSQSGRITGECGGAHVFDGSECDNEHVVGGNNEGRGED